MEPLIVEQFTILYVVSSVATFIVASIYSGYVGKENSADMIHPVFLGLAWPLTWFFVLLFIAGWVATVPFVKVGEWMRKLKSK